MKAIINGRVVLENATVTGQAVLFDEKIVGIVPENEVRDCEIIDAKGRYVLPGLVDMHIHGYLGEDASDGKAEGIRTMARGIAKNGVTSWLPTTMTVSYAELEAAFEAIRTVKKETEGNKFDGAQIMGINAEGPFINPSKKGAQAGEHIRPCDPEFIAKYADIIKVFTVAPEMKGNLAALRRIHKEFPKLLISMGHTSATFEQAQKGVRAGVRHVTHLFNAMTPLMHRDPGVVGCALSDNRLSTELIADTFHVNKNLFKLVSELKGDKLVLITDCTRAGGMPDGEYSLGGQPIYVKGIECRLADGTIAGSVLKLNEAVRNMHLNAKRLPIHKVVRMASLNPAKALGIDGAKGSIKPGKDADFCFADDDFKISRTILRGRTIYSGEDK
ncbi:MAG: N-acetylglucosamine-6-phosphate deacetylase [Clostridiales bacterium]|nr:N-acetylglucosamine-6-phosphate deacetylase [Clostridiales bacterium]